MMKIKILFFLAFSAIVFISCNNGDDLVFDCPDLELNIGDECTYMVEGRPDIFEGKVNEDCNCESETQTGTYDCPDLEANIGDECIDEDGNVGRLDENCKCQSGGTSAYDCPDLEANIGDDCRDANGNLGTINNDCECT